MGRRDDGQDGHKPRQEPPGVRRRSSRSSADDQPDFADLNRSGDSGYNFPDPQQEPDYHPDKFYVSASDSRGHNQPLQVYIPPQVHAMIRGLIESKEFPFRSNSDFVRDAIRHRLQYLQSRLSNIDFQFILQDFFVWSDAEQHAQTLRRNDEACDALCLEIEHIVARAREKHRPKAWIRKQLAIFRQRAQVMPEPWRSEI